MSLPPRSPECYYGNDAACDWAGCTCPCHNAAASEPERMTKERFIELSVAAVRRALSQAEAFELLAEVLEARPELSAAERA